MYLQRLAMNSYVLLRAGWPVEQARQLLANSAATHVIVYRTEPDLYQMAKAGAVIAGDEKVAPGEVKEYYYLYPIGDALAKLKDKPWAQTVFEAFDLHEYVATPAQDAYAEAEQAPDRVVITDQGRLVGFFDADMMPVGQHRGVKGDLGQKSEPRLLTADFPDQVPLNETRSLLVTLAELGATLEQQPGGQPMDVAIGASLTIIVQPKRGFTLVGDGEATFAVTADEEMRQFTLKAVEAGPAEVRVLAFSGGQRVASIVLKPTVVAAGQAAGAQRSGEAQPIEIRAAAEPDLLLLILEGSDGGKPSLTFRLKALDPGLGFNYKQYGPITLERSATEYFQLFFTEIEKLPLQSDNDRQIAQFKLAGKGGELFRKVIPEPLQKDLWTCRERIRTVQVQSEEPWIPWELCKLQGEKDGRVDPGPFFCEAFEITRWLLEVPVRPELHVKNMALIIPKNSGLPCAADERDYMLSLNAPPGRTVTRLPATFLGVKQALINGEHDAWHFTGHGGFRYPDPNRSAMLLEDGQELTPQDLNDEARNVGATGPLVFLNACQIGRGDMSLTDIGGWAAEFLRCGAGAFIGAYWSIYDLPAVEFAKAFYSRLLSGTPIGQAAKEARLAIKPMGDPTWLAYTVWANPGATVEV